ncbi:MAG: nucleotidyltransferase family protein [Alkaliphilus sp.]
MLDLETIRKSIGDLVDKYAVRKISVIGSYANGLATEKSDIDLLVEFSTANISLFKLYEMQEEISGRLNKKVDLIHAPIPEDSLIEIDKVISIYEQ